MKGKILVLLVAMTLLVGVLSGCFEEEEEKPTEVTNTAPAASFTSAVVHNNTTAGGEATFTDGSSDADGDALTYSWDFGDGTGTSTEASPVYTYAANGSYTVTLTVNDGTNDSTPATETIIVGNVAPDADFTYDIDGTNVTFTDASTDANGDTINAWAWDFDDNTTVYENLTQGPVIYDFMTAGDYNVTLMVTEDTIWALTDTKTVKITIP